MRYLPTMGECAHMLKLTESLIRATQPTEAMLESCIDRLVAAYSNLAPVAIGMGREGWRRWTLTGRKWKSLGVPQVRAAWLASTLLDLGADPLVILTCGRFASHPRQPGAIVAQMPLRDARKPRRRRMKRPKVQRPAKASNRSLTPQQVVVSPGAEL